MSDKTSETTQVSSEEEVVTVPETDQKMSEAEFDQLLEQKGSEVKSILAPRLKAFREQHNIDIKSNMEDWKCNQFIGYEHFVLFENANFDIEDDLFKDYISLLGLTYAQVAGWYYMLKMISPNKNDES